MLEILKANVLIAYQQLEQYQLDRYGRGVVSAIYSNYITEKLKGAGCNQTVFEDAAMEAILNAADGTPRMINKYCNQSMLIGDSNKANLITTDIVMQAINDCELG